MIIQQLFEPNSSSFCYLVADQQQGKALLIDPVKEQLDHYLQLLQQHRLTLVASIDTHVHADHITALGDLREYTGCETIIGHPSTMSCADRQVQHNDIIQCGDINLHAIYTPGHTEDSYCFYIDEDEGYLFTGDTLLINGTGRTDFQQGSSQALYHSLFDKILSLPDSTTVYPGHDYKGQQCSTIAKERVNNPRLQVSNWQELAQILDQLNLPRPQLMDIAVPANQSCGNALTAD
ncbi:MBL fold metallo-hydrolase [Oceanicoccus sagamiensis]|uniref:Zn-dependent hydrolase n=1 Tax=Oceanicoccus sagamiensis TaxID=716816 RepID=A0A1X9NFX5_9GAMM|nr:MBL fold metallo-hydrolase [Oceanicoccus sagamiensis]ARN75312.1 Zn-dependent hydrolase [Oceanicoccus sagamiensis]